MARGRDPKDPRDRRNTTPPSRGEWVDLVPLAKPVLPALPRRGKGEGQWSARTRAAWKAWRDDPVTSQYGSSDIAAAIELAYLHEVYVRGETQRAAEVRMRMDGLGLTPKGKRDLRWRPPARGQIAGPADTSGDGPPQPRRERALRAVDPQVA